MRYKNNRLGYLLTGLLLHSAIINAQLLEVCKVTADDRSLFDGVGLALFDVQEYRHDPEGSYKIRMIDDRSDFGKYNYPLYIPVAKTVDTLSLIRELLGFEGDERLCIVPVRCYDPLRSQVYMGETNRYSIQLEALFIINQLYFKKPFKYAAFPVLSDAKGNTETVSGTLLEEAYRQYKSWWKKVESLGLEKSREKGIVPLVNNKVKWFP